MVPGATLPRLAECRDCHEPIRFVRMNATGRNMPINPKPLPPGTELGHGTVIARLAGPALLGYVISNEHPADDRHPYRFTPHWSTCTRGRTKKAPPTPAADAPLF